MKLASAALLVLLCFPLHGLAQAMDSDAVDAILQDALRFWHVPGIAVGIVRDDHVVYLKGHGVKEAGKPDPVTPTAPVPVAPAGQAPFVALAPLARSAKLKIEARLRKQRGNLLRIFFHLAA